MIDRRSFLAASSAVAAGLTTSATGSQPVTETAGRGIVPGVPLDARSRLPAVATEAFANHAVHLKYSDLDAQTIGKAKDRVLDLIGCLIGGAPAAGNPALVDLVHAQGGAPEASVIGYPVRAPAAQVAMTNAVISRSYDFEVMTVVVRGQQVPSHHSPTTCMTALALCEHGRLSGQDFLAALIVGDDICARMLAASGLDFGQGWDGAPIYSAIGATAIAARLLGLSPQQAADAFGLAVDTISGTVQNLWDGATDWKLPQGLAARNAVFTAELAKRGWTGMADALRAPYGFYGQYTAGCAHPEVLTADLGAVFYAEEYFKPYPACAATHSTIECALALRADNSFEPDQVEAVNIAITAAGLNVFVSKPFEARRYPHCDANFSHQWQAANALLHGSVRQEHYSEPALRDPRLLQLIGKTTLRGLPAGQTGTQITVQTRDGRSLVARHPGRPSHNPAESGTSREEHLVKFHQQAAFSGFVSSDHAAEIIRRVADLDAERDMAAFVKALTRTHLRPGAAV